MTLAVRFDLALVGNLLPLVVQLRSVARLLVRGLTPGLTPQLWVQFKAQTLILRRQVRQQTEF